MSRRIVRASAALILGAALFAAGPANPAAAAQQGDLIDATPESVRIDAPAPGGLSTWDMSVSNVTTATVPIELRIDGQSDRLFDGPTPLRLTIRHGADVVVEGSAAELLGSALDLPDLAPGDTYSLTGEASLPAEAGNEYQGESGRLDIRFIAVSSSSATEGVLAVTGGGVATIVVVAVGAVVITSAGILLVSRRRKEVAA